MRTIPALFTQQAESNQHTQTKSLATMQANPTQGETTMSEATDQPTKEQQVDEIVNEGLAIASPFIPGGKVTTQLAAMSGLAPAAIHLGFLFAHLLSHPKVQTVIAASQAASAVDSAAAAAAAAKAAKNRQISDLQKQLEALQAE